MLFWNVFTFLIVYEIFYRYACFLDYLERVNEESDLDSFTTGYKKFGIHINNDGSVYCLEWAPGAKQLYLTGDFSKHKQNTLRDYLNFSKHITYRTIVEQNCENNHLNENPVLNIVILFLTTFLKSSPMS